MSQIGWMSIQGKLKCFSQSLDHVLTVLYSGPQALFSHMGRDATEEFEMLHDDEVIPKYAPDIVIGRVKGQEITLQY